MKKDLKKKQLWNDSRSQGGNKMRTYRELKWKSQFESYLEDVKVSNHRKGLTKLWIIDILNI